MENVHFAECYINDGADAQEVLDALQKDRRVVNPAIQSKDDGHQVVMCGFVSKGGMRDVEDDLRSRFGSAVSFR